VHGLVFPLLTTAEGGKFGKSETGNIWLDPTRTSPYKFYQFWLNTDDQDVERLLRFFTFLPLPEIAAVMAEQARDPASRTAQRRLAEDLTTRVHGAAITAGVVNASRLLFGGMNLAEAGPEVFGILAGEIPTIRIPRAELGRLGVVDALVRAGLASSKSDARRGIQQSGFSVNGASIDQADQTLGAADLRGGGYVLLQKGRRSHVLIELTG
jgi:tyrosyl-tRNA synthetase